MTSGSDSAFSFEQAAARSKAYGSGELLQAYGSGELLQAYGSGSETLAQVHEGGMASGSDSAFSFEQAAARSKAYGSGELLQAHGSGELLQAYGSGSEILAQVHEGAMASGSDSAFSFEQTAAPSKAYGSGEPLQAYGSGELLQAHGSGELLQAYG